MQLQVRVRYLHTYLSNSKSVVVMLLLCVWRTSINNSLWFSFDLWSRLNSLDIAKPNLEGTQLCEDTILNLEGTINRYFKCTEFKQLISTLALPLFMDGMRLSITNPKEWKNWLDCSNFSLRSLYFPFSSWLCHHRYIYVCALSIYDLNTS